MNEPFTGSDHTFSEGLPANRLSKGPGPSRRPIGRDSASTANTIRVTINLFVIGRCNRPLTRGI